MAFRAKTAGVARRAGVSQGEGAAAAALETDFISGKTAAKGDGGIGRRGKRQLLQRNAAGDGTAETGLLSVSQELCGEFEQGGKSG